MFSDGKILLSCNREGRGAQEAERGRVNGEKKVGKNGNNMSKAI